MKNRSLRFALLDVAVGGEASSKIPQDIPLGGLNSHDVGKEILGKIRCVKLEHFVTLEMLFGGFFWRIMKIGHGNH